MRAQAREQKACSNHGGFQFFGGGCGLVFHCPANCEATTKTARMAAIRNIAIVLDMAIASKVEGDVLAGNETPSVALGYRGIRPLAIRRSSRNAVIAWATTGTVVGYRGRS